MYTPLKAVDYLGQALFNLYKERYPAINDETEVTQLTMEQIHQRGVQIPVIKAEVFFKQGAQKPFEKIVIKPSDFEWWAESKDGAWFKLAYEPRFDRLYGYKEPR